MSILTRPNYPLDYLLSCRDMINNYRYLFGPKFVNRASLGRLITNFSWVYNHCFNLRIFHINSHRWGEQSIEKIFQFYLWRSSSNKISNIYTLRREHHRIMKSRYIYNFIIELTMEPVGKLSWIFPLPLNILKLVFPF